MGSIQIINDVKNNDVDAKKVKSIWDEMNPKEKFRLHIWRKELIKLCDEAGITLAGLAQCIGAPINRYPRVYTHLPKEKETYVLIGLALNQKREIVDRWIIKNSKQTKLYAKNEKDLIGIYFLNLLNKERQYDSVALCEMYSNSLLQLKVFKKEYEKEVEDELKEINKLLNEIGVLKEELESLSANDATKRIKIENKLSIMEDVIKRLEKEYSKPMGTKTLESKLMEKDENGDEKGNNVYDFLIQYIKCNQRSFKRSRKNPRDLMNTYVEILLSSLNRTKREHETEWTKFKLKELGLINESLHNYLAGNIEFVQQPELKGTLITYAVQLGMGLEQTNQILKVYGFDELNICDDSYKFAEFSLIPMLICWENNHEDARKWRDKYIFERNVQLSASEERNALKQILSMRTDLSGEYFANYNESFPF